MFKLHGKLVKGTFMIQHDSVNDQFYIPIRVEQDGSILNIDTFFPFEDAFKIEGSMEYSIRNQSEFLSRKIIVAVNPPGGNVLNNQYPIVLKFYNRQNIRVNQLINVLGIFEYRADLFCQESLSDIEYSNTLNCIHVLAIQEPDHFEPCFEFSKARQHFLSLESNSLTTKLLMFLISKISLRKKGLLSTLFIGSYNLNIRLPLDCSLEVGDSLIGVILKITKFYKIIDLSPQLLEKTDFISKMDFTTGKLKQGLLQVPNEAVLIIDERKLIPGILSELATKNIQCLIDMIANQEISFDYGGNIYKVPCDIRVLSISYGKSILPLENFSCVTEQQLSSFVENFNKLDLKVVELIFFYIENCRLIDVKISSNVSAEIEQLVSETSFVEKSSNILDANNLSATINIARLISSSYGCIEMNLDHFHEAKNLIGYVKI